VTKYRGSVRAFFVALMILPLALPTLAQTIEETEKSAIKQDTGEQHATELLRAIAEAIRRCPDYQGAYHTGIATYFYAPINVVWDVERIQSARARESGYVEYIQHSYDILGPMVECKKRDTECKNRNEALKETYDIVSAMDSRAQYRYEFDIGPHGLEFSRALWKHEKDDASHWAATTLRDDGCVGNAVFTIVNRARALIDASSPVAVSSDAIIRPPAIPNELWDAAKQGEVNAQFNIGFLYESGSGVSQDFSEAVRWYRKAADQGDGDAQFHLGSLYSEGRGVPQDYAVAYFWLDLAASGKLETTKPEEVAKVRDDTAAHLTNTVLLQTQERARKWFEDHPGRPSPLK